MNKRDFLKTTLGLMGLAGVSSVSASEVARSRSLLIQESPLAGFQYYEGERIWPRMRVGQALTLHREPLNSQDERAVAVYWKTRKLGYLPRRENAAVSQMMDRGEGLRARLVVKRESHDPWQRIMLRVWA